MVFIAAQDTVQSKHGYTYFPTLLYRATVLGDGGMPRAREKQKEKEMLKRGIRLWIVLSAFIPMAAWGMPLDYEAREAARPLTLPDGMFEVGAGVESGDASNGFSSVSSFLQFRYGITDNLEFIPIGLKYRFLTDSSGNTEATIKLQIPGFGVSNNGSSIFKTSAKGEIKHEMLHGDLALHGIIHYFNDQRHGDSQYLMNSEAYEGGGGIAYSFMPQASVTFDVNYQKINGAQIIDLTSVGSSGTESVEVIFTVLGLVYNTSRFDLRVEYFYSSGRHFYDPNRYSVSYGTSGYSAVATVRF